WSPARFVSDQPRDPAGNPAPYPSNLFAWRRDALHREHFDEIADLDVVEPFEADAAFEAGFHLGRIVFEPAKRSNLALIDHDVVAQQPCLRVAGTGDASLRHHAAGNRAVLRNLECVAYFRHADAHLLERRFEETGHRLLHFVGDVVDDGVLPDVDVLARGDFLRIAIGPDVEPDDDRIGRR